MKPKRRKRRRLQTRARNGSITYLNKRKVTSYEQDADAGRQVGKLMRRSVPDLPEDILLRIHYLMSMRDAARSACLNHAFLHSWKYRPNLIFNWDTIGLNRSRCGGNFGRKVEGILKSHSGIGVKIFRLEYTGISNCDASRYLDSWFQVAVKPGIEELTLMLCETNTVYNFPCSLLSDGVRDSVRRLKLGSCAFRPTSELGPLRSLTSLHLYLVSITENELECLLSNSLALEVLDLDNCMEIGCLKIPCMLRKLRCLSVFGCSRLEVIENKAPNISSFYLRGYRETLSLGETLQMKKLNMHRTNLVHYARAVLPSRMPNLETLVLGSDNEVVNTPMLPTKFLYLKHLTIRFISGLTFSPSYDYLSLVSFLDASPSLETFILDVFQLRMEHESIFADPHLRQMPEHCHGFLKTLKIGGFCSAKSLVELTCYVLKNAVSLECLTLDIVHGGAFRCDQSPDTTCSSIGRDIAIEAPRALSAIRTYIDDRVPSTVKLTVMEPCSRCHAPSVPAHLPPRPFRAMKERLEQEDMAPAEEMPPVEIHGVTDALPPAARQPCRVCVVSVQLSHAQGIVSALEREVRVRVGNMALLRELSRLDRGLVTVVCNVAPVLAADPHDVFSRADLLEHGWRITLTARRVGGAFYDAARRVGRFLRRQADAPAETLAANVDVVRALAIGLRNTFVALPMGLGFDPGEEHPSEDMLESDQED